MQIFMKKFYYLSKFKIQSVDLKNYRLKFVGLVAGIFTASAIVLSSFYFLYVTFISPPKDLTEIKNENVYLKNKLNSLLAGYKEIGQQLDSLKDKTKSLRIAANLPPIDKEQAQLGIGGKAAGSISEIIEGKNPDLKGALASFDEILKKFEFEKGNTEQIQTAFSRNKDLYRAIPAIKPCEGELAEHGFGMRYHPILNVVRMHEGIDIITDVGTRVSSSADGVIEFVGIRNGLGNCVVVDHGFGYQTVYGHLSKMLVKEGQKVLRGTQIALTGNSGLSTGPHLHYEVLHNGTNLDPEQFFFDDSNLFSSK